ncbi:MAG TPA: BlaI/MecI/CopY family transcriptional regulator [Gemmatimonadales bacterium]|jgi:predicted transcriptional regulator|nr:BlaI/MecI/CopY family transcriptional regulator [Gemmatimonadales bacterium]
MPTPNDLSDLQLSVLRVLWNRGEASAQEVQSALEKERPLAVTTVATVLSRLEKRGVVRHRSNGRLFIYRPAVTQDDVSHSMLGALVESVFQGDPTALISHLVTRRDVSSGDLDRMRRLIEEARGGRGGRRGR